MVLKTDELSLSLQIISAQIVMTHNFLLKSSRFLRTGGVPIKTLIRGGENGQDMFINGKGNGGGLTHYAQHNPQSPVAGKV